MLPPPSGVEHYVLLKAARTPTEQRIRTTAFFATLVDRDAIYLYHFHSLVVGSEENHVKSLD